MFRPGAKFRTFGRMEERLHHAEAVRSAEKELAGEDATERFDRMEKNEEGLERLLAHLKETPRAESVGCRCC